MRVPDWWEAALLLAAAWRIFYLIAHDDITEGLRSRYVTGKWLDWLQCPFCFGGWLAIVVWGMWQFWPHFTLGVSGLLLVWTGVIAAHKFLHAD